MHSFDETRGRGDTYTMDTDDNNDHSSLLVLLLLLLVMLFNNCCSCLVYLVFVFSCPGLWCGWWCGLNIIIFTLKSSMWMLLYDYTIIFIIILETTTQDTTKT